jgi:hypothetical protein
MPDVRCSRKPTGVTAVLPIAKIKTRVLFGAFRKIQYSSFDLKCGINQKIVNHAIIWKDDVR